MSKTFSAVMHSFLAAALVMMTACNSQWESMPDAELAAKAAECASINDPAPAMIQVCKNYERECQRRRSNGIYAC